MKNEFYVNVFECLELFHLSEWGRLTRRSALNIIQTVWMLMRTHRLTHIHFRDTINRDKNVWNNTNISKKYILRFGTYFLSVCIVSVSFFFPFFFASIYWYFYYVMYININILYCFCCLNHSFVPILFLPLSVSLSSFTACCYAITNSHTDDDAFCCTDCLTGATQWVIEYTYVMCRIFHTL